MSVQSSSLIAAHVAAYQDAWTAYQYGDRDPQVKVMARAFEQWLQRRHDEVRIWLSSQP